MADRKKKPSTASKRDKRALKRVGKKIHGYRKKRKLSVYDVTGDDMPIRTRQHWQSIEAGKNINLTTLFGVARSLKVDPSLLLEDI